MARRLLRARAGEPVSAGHERWFIEWGESDTGAPIATGIRCSCGEVMFDVFDGLFAWSRHSSSPAEPVETTEGAT